jgi:hypothetical protein
MFLGVGGTLLVVFLLAMRQWHNLNSKDLGTMSQQWVAEYNAHHP